MFVFRGYLSRVKVPTTR